MGTDCFHSGGQIVGALARSRAIGDYSMENIFHSRLLMDQMNFRGRQNVSGEKLFFQGRSKLYIDDDLKTSLFHFMDSS